GTGRGGDFDQRLLQRRLPAGLAGRTARETNTIPSTEEFRLPKLAGGLDAVRPRHRLPDCERLQLFFEGSSLAENANALPRPGEGDLVPFTGVTGNVVRDSGPEFVKRVFGRWRGSYRVYGVYGVYDVAPAAAAPYLFRLSFT